MTLTGRAISYARRHPGHTATEIAHALKARPATVSGVLFKAVRRKKLSRYLLIKPKPRLAGWRYERPLPGDGPF